MPKRIKENFNVDIFNELKTTIVIPTYKPSYFTYQLIYNVLDWYKNIDIVIVDDSGDSVYGRQVNIFKNIKKIADKEKRVSLVKTPKNLFKAGALNYGIAFVQKSRKKNLPNVIITCDDDVIITKRTIPEMVNTLYANINIGATCSMVKVKNKNKNLLTRLQGLEYHGFNITKIADNGFFNGPLVMQGMLTAFRMSALLTVEGFSESNLIEDYEITANLKKNGWGVVMAPDCWAWTNVPEDFQTLWKQRVRWTYGGLTVLENYYRHLATVMQDAIGHFMFITLTVLVVVSFMAQPVNPIQRTLVSLILFVAYLHFSVAYYFNIFTLRYYKNADWTDRGIRLTVIPEFIYSNMLSLVLIGAYLFYLYNKSIGKISALNRFYKQGLSVFSRFGFSLSWGTKKEVLVPVEGGGIYG